MNVGVLGFDLLRPDWAVTLLVAPLLFAAGSISTRTCAGASPAFHQSWTTPGAASQDASSPGKTPATDDPAPSSGEPARDEPAAPTDAAATTDPDKESVPSTVSRSAPPPADEPN